MNGYSLAIADYKLTTGTYRRRWPNGTVEESVLVVAGQEQIDLVGLRLGLPRPSEHEETSPKAQCRR